MPDTGHLRRIDRETGHDYLSTACFHGEHGMCRQLCKYCFAWCRCDCHERPVNVPAA